MTGEVQTEPLGEGRWDCSFCVSNLPNLPLKMTREVAGMSYNPHFLALGFGFGSGFGFGFRFGFGFGFGLGRGFGIRTCNE